MSEFRMPVLGADMESGTVVDWLVGPGDEVKRGQVVAVVDTAKSAIEVEVFEDGIVEEIVVPVGREVPVGAVLARLRSRAEAAGEPGIPPAAAAPVAAGPAVGEQPPPAAAPTPVPAAGAAGAAAPRPSSPVVRALAKRLGVDLTEVTPTGARGRITRADVQRAAAARRPPGEPESPGPPQRGGDGRRPRRPASSPLARRRAGAAGLDLGEIRGTGPGGAITAADVAAAAAGPARPGGRSTPAGPAPAPRRTTAAGDRQVAMRRAIGELMARSKREIPHYYLATTIDMTAALTWLREQNAGLPVAQRMIPSTLLFKATALAARSIPEMNGHFVEGEFRPAPTVRLGVPVALRGGGLLTPAVEGADALAPVQLMARLRELVGRAKAGKLRGSELAEPTLTVTNLGDQGVEVVYGVIYPPQVALVGFGAVVERPWAVGGLLGVRPLVTATLSGDHRASDGHRGGLFLAEIGERLQHPEAL